jgi:hypothetical protein
MIRIRLNYFLAKIVVISISDLGSQAFVVFILIALPMFSFSKEIFLPNVFVGSDPELGLGTQNDL